MSQTLKFEDGEDEIILKVGIGRHGDPCAIYIEKKCGETMIVLHMCFGEIFHVDVKCCKVFDNEPCLRFPRNI